MRRLSIEDVITILILSALTVVLLLYLRHIQRQELELQRAFQSGFNDCMLQKEE